LREEAEDSSESSEEVEEDEPMSSPEISEEEEIEGTKSGVQSLLTDVKLDFVSDI
jgi:hypothetical protein